MKVEAKCAICENHAECEEITLTVAVCPSCAANSTEEYNKLLPQAAPPPFPAPPPPPPVDRRPQIVDLLRRAADLLWEESWESEGSAAAFGGEALDDCLALRQMVERMKEEAEEL